MPGTAIASPSTARALSTKASGGGSRASSISSDGNSFVRRSGGARQANLSSGARRAIATARSGSSASAREERSVEETKATRLPTNTRSPRSEDSARSMSSSFPSRYDTFAETPSTNSASAASAPAARAAQIRLSRRICGSRFATKSGWCGSGGENKPEEGNDPDHIGNPGQNHSYEPQSRRADRPRKANGMEDTADRKRGTDPVDHPDRGAEDRHGQGPHEQDRRGHVFGVVGVRPKGAGHFGLAAIANVRLGPYPRTRHQHAENQHDERVQRRVEAEGIIGRFK